MGTLPLVVPDTSPGPLSIMASFEGMKSSAGKVSYPLVGGPAHGALVWFWGEPPDTVSVPDPKSEATPGQLFVHDEVSFAIKLPQFVRYELRRFQWDSAVLSYYEWPELKPEQRRVCVSSWILAGFLEWKQSLDSRRAQLDALTRSVAEAN